MLPQLSDDIEIVIVDGASIDGTADYVKNFINLHGNKIKIIQPLSNGGIDLDYDLAVLSAKGKYCWLFSDDDIIKPDALKNIQKVVSADEYSFLIANSDHLSIDMSQMIDPNRLKVREDIYFPVNNYIDAFKMLAGPSCLISCVIVNKNFWLTRRSEEYFGTYFSHVGTLFKSKPNLPIYLISKTIFSVRQGNLSWSDKIFYIWMISFPKLIWSLILYDSQIKSSITHAEPWRKMKNVIGYRAMGSYNISHFHAYIKNSGTSIYYKFYCLFLAVFPVRPLWFSLIIYLYFFKPNSKTTIYDLTHDSCFGKILFRPSSGNRL